MDSATLHVSGDVTGTVNLELEVANLLAPDANPADNNEYFDTDVGPAGAVPLYLPVVRTADHS